eukprot:CAMPEP_0194285632 /NCGR_PEP_ID=MMETSP0169-20130528/30640_1 /TAXON_ID=218684 /ORGANISM="Corethron pennatum, Strain L29A3" /LENGTH=137 /DNA_ID=CAMNT_0039031809 /DNA_START=210 /DNA_END=620 /DNA_ORIENTATION=-
MFVGGLGGDLSGTFSILPRGHRQKCSRRYSGRSPPVRHPARPERLSAAGSSSPPADSRESRRRLDIPRPSTPCSPAPAGPLVRRRGTSSPSTSYRRRSARIAGRTAPRTPPGPGRGEVRVPRALLSARCTGKNPATT